MALKIAMLKNHLPTCRSPFLVRSGNYDVVELDQFLEIMSRGRTTLSMTDITATMRLYEEELIKLLSEGKAVKTPTGTFFLCASGTVESLEESFLPADASKNHEVRLHHRAERGFEDSVLADLTIVRQERPDFGSPSIRFIAASGSETPDSIHPGDLIQIRGLRLRFDPKEASQGVFFVDASGKELRSPFYPMIKPASIMASVPAAIVPGSYELVLRAAVNGKDVREDRFAGVEIVAPAS